VVTRGAPLWLTWALLAAIAFIATAWGSWQSAGALYPTDSYADERFLRASNSWPMVAALSGIVALPLAGVSFLLKGPAHLVLVLFMALGILLVGLVAGGLFIDVGTPGPGDPANL
jgi:hypothetical protein